MGKEGDETSQKKYKIIQNVIVISNKNQKIKEDHTFSNIQNGVNYILNL